MATQFCDHLPFDGGGLFSRVCGRAYRDLEVSFAILTNGRVQGHREPAFVGIANVGQPAPAYSGLRHADIAFTGRYADYAINKDRLA
jgi:hypothetical protein